VYWDEDDVTFSTENNSYTSDATLNILLGTKHLVQHKDSVFTIEELSDAQIEELSPDAGDTDDDEDIEDEDIEDEETGDDQDDEGDSTPLYMWIIISGGAVLLIALVIIFVIRHKRSATSGGIEDNSTDFSSL